MKIKVARNEEVLGEFSREEIEAKIAKGVFNPTDLFWRNGMVEWKPLQNLDFHIPKASKPSPQGRVQRTDSGQHHKGTSRMKMWATLIIIVGLLMSMIASHNGNSSSGAMAAGTGMLVGGFVLFVIARLRQ